MDQSFANYLRTLQSDIHEQLPENQGMNHFLTIHSKHDQSFINDSSE